MQIAAVKVVIAIAGVNGLMLPEKKVASKLSVEGVGLEGATTHNYEKAFIFTVHQCEKHYETYHFTDGVPMQSDTFLNVGMRLDEGYHSCLLSFVSYKGT
jgi:hypothetical protein